MAGKKCPGQHAPNPRLSCLTWGKSRMLLFLRNYVECGTISQVFRHRRKEVG